MRFLEKKYLKARKRTHDQKEREREKGERKEQKTSNNLIHLNLTITTALNINELR